MKIKGGGSHAFMLPVMDAYITTSEGDREQVTKEKTECHQASVIMFKCSTSSSLISFIIDLLAVTFSSLFFQAKERLEQYAMQQDRTTKKKKKKGESTAIQTGGRGEERKNHEQKVKASGRKGNRYRKKTAAIFPGPRTLPIMLLMIFPALLLAFKPLLKLLAAW
jgi:hypothetical protein